MTRILAVMTLLIGLAACTNPNDLDQAPADLGAGGGGVIPFYVLWVGWDIFHSY